MNITFGIITDGNSDAYIQRIIESINNLRIPFYEIIIIGNSRIKSKFIKIIPFDENQKKGWLTKKKNLITKYATYENIVYLHDYILFDEGWYQGYLKYGDNFQVCMNIIQNADGSRFRDWVLDPHSNKNIRNNLSHKLHDDKSVSLGCLLPYEELSLSKFMYISGSYWMAKKKIMHEFPLDENLVWGEAEDLVWSNIVKKKYEFSFNPHSIVKTLKQKNNNFHDSGQFIITMLKLYQHGVPIYIFSLAGLIRRFFKKVLLRRKKF